MHWWKPTVMALEQINPLEDDQLSERDELVYACTNMNGRAKREMRVVGTVELPTPWDLRHRAIDEYLTLLDLTS